LSDNDRSGGQPDALPDLTVQSSLWQLDPKGEKAPAVALNDLDSARPRSEIRMGSEKYSVEGSIGEGGMGKVYRVLDRDLHRTVALKMVLDGQAELERRFLEEAQVMGQLEHPNIVSVYELGVTKDRRPYYTMPLVRGKTLREILDALLRKDAAVTRVYSLTRLMQVFLQTTLGVAYAHAKGVLHRDLKPSNVMLGEHGEVQILDWGLAKVIGGKELRQAPDLSLTAKGLVVGTPSYMSPEQVVDGDLDERSDIYALGVLLYELLTLAVPFRGNPFDVMSAHRSQQPEPPRLRAPARKIPVPLERACLRALAKAPSERQQSARELHDEVQAWLEAEADKRKRHERAGELASEGRALLETYRGLKREIASGDAEAERLRASFHEWQSVAEKAPLYQAEDQVASTRRRLVETSSRLVMTLSGALVQDEAHPEARGALAEYYWERFLEAEEKLDADEAQYFAQLTSAFHDGKYARELAGDGSLSLDSDPPGAEVILHPLVEERLRLVPGPGRRLGATPLGPLPLAMGSYLAVLKRDGFRDVAYPIFIPRNRDWRGRVRLRAEEEVGTGYIHIPAGPFILGGDPEAQGWSLTRGAPELADFFIAAHPVTVGEYREFLDHLSRNDPAQALGRAPREGAEGKTLWTWSASGLLTPPETSRANHPVVGLSWHDANAYCLWRSEKEGRPVRLPTESEWEKASRGVDGRWYPWGRRFDASLCNMRDSRREGPGIVGVEEFPTDLSIYGVRGLAGNVRDWTATRIARDGSEDSVVVRGGAWNLPAVVSRAAHRFWLPPGFVSDYLGFRLACSA
jgi:serine/threonine-protein kinase